MNSAATNLQLRLGQSPGTSPDGQAGITARAYSILSSFMPVYSEVEVIYDADETYSPGGWGEAEVRRVSTITLPYALTKAIVAFELEAQEAPPAEITGHVVLTTFDTGEELLRVEATGEHALFLDGRSVRKVVLDISLRAVSELGNASEPFGAVRGRAFFNVADGVDCNHNGVLDGVDLATGTSSDCNDNMVPDECDRDCNRNRVPDDCDLASGTSNDCDADNVPDECATLDCNNNDIPDACDIRDGDSEDCDGNAAPDECDVLRPGVDCDFDSQVDTCQIDANPALDCNADGQLDVCQVEAGDLVDCDDNGRPDLCQIAEDPGSDCNGNEVPDPCDVASGEAADCDGNGEPDQCDVAAHPEQDANQNGFLDECEAEVLYVDGRAAGAGTGLDWENAYTTLDAALEHANSAGGAVPEIRVAQGSYVPSHRTDASDPRSATFLILYSLRLRGGFAGLGSPDPSAQDSAVFPTALSGDLASDDTPDFGYRSDNAYHVIIAHGPSVLLEQVTVVGGNAAEYGGGVHFLGQRLEVARCDFRENQAGPSYAPATAEALTGCRPGSPGGGAIESRAGMLVIESSTFEANSASVGGAVLASDLNITGSTFTENNASCGGGLAIEEGSAALWETYFAENSALGGGSLYAYHANLIAEYSSFYRNSAYWGGAVELYGVKNVRLDNCAVTGNTADAHGGAIADIARDDYESEGHSRVMITNGHLRSNFARQSGGAVYSESRIVVENTLFLANRAGGAGGAIAARDFTITDSSFHQNEASEGGALANWEEIVAPLQPTVINTELYGNFAVLGGAASLRNFWIERCRIQGNVGDVGAGLALDADGQSWLRNSLVTGNDASWYGGGLVVGSGMVGIENCTIAGNSAELLAGGIFASPGMLMANNIVWQNTIGDEPPTLLSQVEGAQLAELRYNVVQGWHETDGGQGNIGADPLFVKSGQQDTHYHVLPNSPAIDSGDPDFAAEPGEADLDGKPRVLCGRVDRGAYEFGGVGDMDCDRALTLTDFSEWSACETGPGEPQMLGDCQALDAQVDGTIDLHDFAKLQVMFAAPAG